MNMMTLVKPVPWQLSQSFLCGPFTFKAISGTGSLDLSFSTSLGKYSVPTFQFFWGVTKFRLYLNLQYVYIGV